MMKQQTDVQAFHAATNAHIGDLGRPAFQNITLRLDLMLEELVEIADAAGYNLLVTEKPDRSGFTVAWAADPDLPPRDLLKAIDGLGDLLYVLLGTAVEWGIDLAPYFDEIHRSNMTKVGGPVREDGKRLKPVGYRPPNLRQVYEQQLEDYGHRCTCTPCQQAI